MNSTASLSASFDPDSRRSDSLGTRVASYSMARFNWAKAMTGTSSYSGSAISSSLSFPFFSLVKFVSVQCLLDLVLRPVYQRYYCVFLGCPASDHFGALKQPQNDENLVPFDGKYIGINASADAVCHQRLAFSQKRLGLRLNRGDFAGREIKK